MVYDRACIYTPFDVVAPLHVHYRLCSPPSFHLAGKALSVRQREVVVQGGGGDSVVTQGPQSDS